MSVTTQNIDSILVLQDAEVELAQLSSIEVAPLPEGGIEIIDHYSDSMLESGWQRHRLYLCQEGTGYFCDLTEEPAIGSVGRTGEVLTPGPEDVYVSPVPFFDEGIAEDEAIVVICDYADEAYTGAVNYGTRVVIYYPPQTDRGIGEYAVGFLPRLRRTL